MNFHIASLSSFTSFLILIPILIAVPDELRATPNPSSSLSPVASVASPTSNTTQGKSSEATAHQVTSDENALGFRIAVGISSGVNGSFLQKPKDEYYYSDNSYIEYVYPGFAGVGGVIGAQLDLGWKFITLTTGYTQSFDQAEGKADGRTVTINQNTGHIPLTIRFELPSKIVSPSIFGGIDWVSPSDSKIEMANELIPKSYQGVQSASYQAWIFGLGFDVMLSAEMRMPIRFYGILNPTPKDSLNDSIDLNYTLVGNVLTNSEAIVKGEWDWQAGITVGFSYDVYRR